MINFPMLKNPTQPANLWGKICGHIKTSILRISWGNTESAWSLHAVSCFRQSCHVADSYVALNRIFNKPSSSMR